MINLKLLHIKYILRKKIYDIEWQINLINGCRIIRPILLRGIIKYATDNTGKSRPTSDVIRILITE